jgi:hypothetical protein
MNSVFGNLCDYLASKFDRLETKRQDVESHIVDGSVQNGSGSARGGVHLANFNYTGILLIDGLKAEKLPLLIVLVKSWLDANDPLRHKMRLGNPELDAVSVDEMGRRKNVQMSCDFVDQLKLVEADEATGDVYIDDIWYKIDEPVINTAENLTVNGAENE